MSVQIGCLHRIPAPKSYLPIFHSYLFLQNIPKLRGQVHGKLYGHQPEGTCYRIIWKLSIAADEWKILSYFLFCLSCKEWIDIMSAQIQIRFLTMVEWKVFAKDTVNSSDCQYNIISTLKLNHFMLLTTMSYRVKALINLLSKANKFIKKYHLLV